MPDTEGELPRKTLALKGAPVEYRVVFNEVEKVWDVYRNGAPTGIRARRKRISAVDSAIRNAKAELETAGMRISVTCLRDGVLETVWKGS
jgi:hypothetical protein